MSISIARREDHVTLAASQTPAAAPELTVSIAFSPEEVRESQRLRYRVFAEEMGARLKTAEPGLDVDDHDPWCQHIIVRDQVTREVVASTRVLFDAEARLAGGFYSATEFDIEPLLRGSRRIMEIGRTCVHADYRRSGAAISLLWSGLARFIDIRRYDYMIGCASIPMGEHGAHALAAYRMLREKHLLPEPLRVTPRLHLPERAAAAANTGKVALPPLLKAYIRLGARIGGEPCWDPLFDCADLFIVLSPQSLQKRYAKHFLER